jgi:hypothetical protein
MDEAIAFLKEFTRREYEAQLAWHGDPDDIYRAKVEHVEALCDGLELYFSRPEDPSPEQLQKWAAKRPRLMERKVFVVQRYDHPELGTLFRAVLSDHINRGSLEYSDAYVVAHRSGGLRIVSHAGLCMRCSVAGGVRDHCSACSGRGWNEPTGLDILDLGKPVDTRKLQPPDDEVQRAAYDAL